MRHQLPCDACARAGKTMVSMYRCPRCMRTSCSLACVKSHKDHYSCDGIRDRVAPVPKRDYTEAHFMSDYTLLEETRRAVDSANAARPRNYRDHRAPKKTVYPDAIPRRRMELLAREAAKRGIDLRFMPSMFLRHRRNSSNVRPVVLEEAGGGEDRSFDKVMIWCMEVVFWGRDGGTRVVKISDVDEDTPMKNVLEGAVGSLKIKKDRLTGKEDPYIDFLDVPAEKISAFLKNETGLIKRLADAPIKLPDVYLKKAKRRKMADGVHVETYDMEYDTRKFNPIETGSKVRDSLYGRSIVEYPIVHVVVKGSQEEKQIITQLKDLFEKPEPGASEDSDSEDEPEYEPEEGEVKEKEGDDKPMPDASQERGKVDTANKKADDGGDDIMRPSNEKNDGTRQNAGEAHRPKEAEKQTLTDILSKQEGNSMNQSASNTRTVGISEAMTLGTKNMKSTDDTTSIDERTSFERETTANGSSPSLENIEPLPPGHFDYTRSEDKRQLACETRLASRGGKEPIVRAKENDSEYDNDEGVDDSESETESLKGEVPIPEKQPIQPELFPRVGKRKSRFSDLQTNGDSQEETGGDEGDDSPLAKRQKVVYANMGSRDAEKPAELAVAGQNKANTSPPTEDGNAKKSPPLPFAFEYDSALLSDRIPRRKKLTNSGSLQTLKSC